MTRKVIEKFEIINHKFEIEADWSSASYWYEFVAIHGGELLLEGLKEDSIQGDRIVADIYAKCFGVETTFTEKGAKIVNSSNRQSLVHRQSSIRQLEIDFTNCPDLYPAVALTCEKLGVALEATGIDRLRFKESDRLEAVRLHEVRNDHRIAMALMCADYAVSEKDQACISKSYPEFSRQLSAISIQHITPIKGVNDDNLGKKHALSKLIHAASSEYVWLHDDDVVLPEAATIVNNFDRQSIVPRKSSICQFDIIILPLRMESTDEKPNLLERLQIAEYAAIQELTMRMAKKEQAVMCSGANLIVRREAWLACESELHPEIPSGDDMFLLEAMKRHGYTIGVIDEPDYTAVVRPVSTWRAFFRQRMRWAGKAPHYKDKDIIRCGTIVVVANLLQILCPLIILIKFPIEYSLIRQREATLHRTPYTLHHNKTTWYVALLLEIIYPFYLFASLLCGLFRKNTW